MGSDDEAHLFFNLYSQRMYIIISLMSGMCVLAYMRGSLGMSMTCMVNSTAVALEHASSAHKHEPLQRGREILNEYTIKCNALRRGFTNKFSNSKALNDYGGDIIWSQHKQNLLLSSMSLGSIITMLPAGYLADRYSPVTLIKVATLTFSLMNLLFPTLAMYFNFWSVWAARFVSGLGEGFISPSIFSLISRWVPNHEKSQAIALFTIGSQIAGVLFPPVTALFCASVFRWAGNFYSTSILMFVWLTIFHFVGVDSPSKSKVISTSEREYLEQHIHSHNKKLHGKRPSIPFKQIFTSRAVLSALYCHFTFGLYIAMVSLFMPIFFKEVLFLNMKENGFYSSIPPFFQIFAKITWAIFIDRLKRKKILTHTRGCRISHAIGSMSCGTFFILIGYFSDCSNPMLTILFMTIMAIGTGTSSSGAITALVSLAPIYTGFLTSISTAILISGTMALPLLVSVIRVHGTVEEWRTVFYIVGALTFSSTIVFTLFGEAEIQEWAQGASPKLPSTIEQAEILPIEAKNLILNEEKGKEEEQQA
ncbi:unnamed protein product [Bursaphelenchus okinawaensis]|uniref:Major facilitator superfamily (MFS) profile domain-containing protein n=1 Tax=Bursaphelenchus okinawaensis TaxID=465554 RepID=A0A811LRY7_9BILA|nr:unnamed protein product [Bursaphelenchus okinawaensis]CAG9127751.1 unnamed protein product [Bursaphelenchus okinawaensis]